MIEATRAAFSGPRAGPRPGGGPASSASRRRRPAPSGGLRSDEGFSAVEVLVALLLVTLVLLAFSSLQVEMVNDDARSDTMTRLIGAASAKMEELMQEPFDTLADGTDQVTLATGETLDRSWTIQADTPMADTKTITVTATGPGPDDFQARIDTIRTPGS